MAKQMGIMTALCAINVMASALPIFFPWWYIAVLKHMLH